MNGRYVLHNGIDLQSTMGDLVRASVNGDVVFAGTDPHNRLAYSFDRPFYGKAVVIRLDRRLPTPDGDQDIFLLLGHLQDVYVQAGTTVTETDIVGSVGQTGIAIGPHLHMEVRVGANRYQNAVNPLLWIKPPRGRGVLAIRLVSADGRIWESAHIYLTHADSNTALHTQNYRVANGIQYDPYWGETTAVSNLAPGLYTLRTSLHGEQLTAQVRIEQGKTTFVTMISQQ